MVSQSLIVSRCLGSVMPLDAIEHQLTLIGRTASDRAENWLAPLPALS
jgi:hypothetical protein